MSNKKIKKILKYFNDPIFFGAEHLKNITYHSGKAVYLDKIGLTMLLQKSKVSNPSTIQAILDNPVMKKLGITFEFGKDSKNDQFVK